MEILKADSIPNLQDMDEFIQEWEKREQISWLTPNIIKVLKEKSLGNFLYCKSVLSFLRKEYGNQVVASSQVEESIQKLPKELKGLYSEFFRRVWTEKEEIRAFRKFLRCLVGCFSPISTRLIADLTNLEEEEIEDWTKKYQAFFSQDEQGRFSIYHKSFSDWLTTDSNSPFYCRIVDSHKVFANYGLIDG